MNRQGSIAGSYFTNRSPTLVMHGPRKSDMGFEDTPSSLRGRHRNKRARFLTWKLITWSFVWRASACGADNSPPLATLSRAHPQIHILATVRVQSHHVV